MKDRVLVFRQALGEDIDLETRLDRKTLIAKHIGVVYDTHSRGHVKEKVEVLRKLLKDAPEFVDTVEVAGTGADAIHAARARRARLG